MDPAEYHGVPGTSSHGRRHHHHRHHSHHHHHRERHARRAEYVERDPYDGEEERDWAREYGRGERRDYAAREFPPERRDFPGREYLDERPREYSREFPDRYERKEYPRDREYDYPPRREYSTERKEYGERKEYSGRDIPERRDYMERPPYKPPSPPPPDIVPSTDVIHQSAPPPVRPKNYKLLMDPFLIKGCTKLYRYEGIVPNDPTYPPVVVKDPRSAMSKVLWSKLEPLDLPVPQFKIDSNYVGVPPAVEVTISNLNDNIDKGFLFDMVHKFGPIEELRIFYHPLTNKHLGLARIIFKSVKAAAACVDKLGNTSVMGKVLRVFLDAFGEECTKMFEELTDTKKPEPPAPIAPSAPDVPEDKSAPSAPGERDRDDATSTASSSTTASSSAHSKSHHSNSSKSHHQVPSTPSHHPPAPHGEEAYYHGGPPSSTSSSLPSTPLYPYHHPYPPPIIHPSPMAPPWGGDPSSQPAPPPPPQTRWRREEEKEEGIRVFVGGNKINVGGIPISSEEEDEPHHHKHHHRERHNSATKKDRRGSWNETPLPPGVDEEEEEETADGPLSVPPSPFLSEEIYLNCFKRAIEMALEAREREEREAKGYLEKEATTASSSAHSKSHHSNSSKSHHQVPSTPSHHPPAPHVSILGLVGKFSPFDSVQCPFFHLDMKRKAPVPGKLSPKSKRVRKSTEDASSSSSEEEGLIKDHFRVREILACVNQMGDFKEIPGQVSDSHNMDDLDDKMSLASLSSGDEKIQEVLQSQVLNVGVPPQGVPLGPQLHLPPHLHHLYAPHPGAPLYPGPFWPHPTFVFHPGGAPTPVGRQVPSLAMPVHHGGPHMPPTLQSVVMPVQPQQQTPSDPSLTPQVQITNTLVDRLSTELKQILKRDINKKMVESIAFPALESWWDRELQKQTEPTDQDSLVDRLSTELKQILKRDINKKMVESIAFPALESWWDRELQKQTEPTDQDGQSADQKDSFALGGFGLGFRATMPKMPSFRMKRKAPVPGKLSPKSKRVRKSTEDASSSSSEEEGLIKGSDDELDTDTTSGPQRPSSPAQRSPSPTKSVSSKYSSSSEQSSSSSSEEEESEDSDAPTVRDSKALSPISDEDLPISVSLSKRRRQSADSAVSGNRTPASRKPTSAAFVYTPSEDSDSELDLATKQKEKIDAKKAFDKVKREKKPTTPLRKGKFIYSSSSSDEDESKEKKEDEKRPTKDVKEDSTEVCPKDVSVVLDRIDVAKEEGKERKKKEKEEEEKKKEEEERVPTPPTPVLDVEDDKEDGEIDDKSDRARSITPIPSLPPTPGRGTLSSSCDEEDLSLAVRTKRLTKKPRIKTPPTPDINTGTYYDKSDRARSITPIPSLPPTPGRGTLSSSCDEEDLSLAVRTKRLTKKPRIKTPPTPDINTEAEAVSPPPVLDFVKSPSPVSSEFMAMVDHSYCRPKSSPSEDAESLSAAAAPDENIMAHDHGYFGGPPPPRPAGPKPQLSAQARVKTKEAVRRPSSENKENKKARLEAKQEKREKKEERRKERERGVRASYQKRDMKTEMELMFSFLTRGIDAEDISYIRRSYQAMLGDDTLGFWLNDTHWVDHPVTYLPNPKPPAHERKKKRATDELHVHATGCARTEGFYKIDSQQKAQHKYHFGQTIAQQIERAQLEGKVASASVVKLKVGSASASISREARSNQRRLLTAFGTATDSDLLKFNILKFRKKQLRFAKSAIHDWGLFAMEPIAADEMI
ncbi:histone-lysine N-methyltransferase SETD1 [Diaphorina citri]|uniref:Histone-lysine N-methyltransferase SETD1 n=1 Tax=Diaphorina citri TaxID=121845 RepID=A0A3Q0J159_DIACI|nr:histone-lysine N-methyltransferase SETD1 [Diaphorina citri]